MKIGIDLGGTKIELRVLNELGEDQWVERIPTPQSDYQELLQHLDQLIAKAVKENQVTEPKIGMGTPGAISTKTGAIKNSNTTYLIGKKIHLDLEQLTGYPVRVANDANCFTLSEAVDGAAQDGKTVFGIIIGTGTGGGICVDKKIWNGANAIGGEWGHNSLPWPSSDYESPGPECYCGLSGCIETFLSGPGLARDYHYRTQTQVQGPEITKLAHHDKQAQAVLATYRDRFARATASVINILDPDVIVIGGGVSNMPDLIEKVPEIWPKYVFSDSVETKLVRAQHGDSSGVRGAAWLWY